MHLLQKYAVRHGKRLAGFTDRALLAMRAHAWPGNVRELENLIERGVILTPSDESVDADLLRAMGYYVSWVSPPGKDGGIDILAQPDVLGTRPPRIKVQVKRQKEAVSVDGLRSFMALLGDSDVGLFVCTGGFTKDAATEARTQEKRRITLIGLDTLFDLWVEHYGKLTDQARRRLPLRPIQFLSPQG